MILVVGLAASCDPGPDDLGLFTVPEAVTTTVSGAVVERETGQPIKAEIQLFSRSTELLGNNLCFVFETVMTDEDGRFEVTFTMEAAHRAYFVRSYLGGYEFVAPSTNSCWGARKLSRVPAQSVTLEMSLDG
jgi:hypothetical protein